MAEFKEEPSTQQVYMFLYAVCDGYIIPVVWTLILTRASEG